MLHLYVHVWVRHINDHATVYKAELEAIYQDYSYLSPHYKHTKLLFIGQDKNNAKRILNLSWSDLTKQIAKITGLNCLSYIQFKADPKINPLCRLCGEENETFRHHATECPRLKTYRDEVFQDKDPTQNDWK